MAGSERSLLPTLASLIFGSPTSQEKHPPLLAIWPGLGVHVRQANCSTVEPPLGYRSDHQERPEEDESYCKRLHWVPPRLRLGVGLRTEVMVRFV
jgi:hypothetical protein